MVKNNSAHTAQRLCPPKLLRVKIQPFFLDCFEDAGHAPRKRRQQTTNQDGIISPITSILNHETCGIAVCIILIYLETNSTLNVITSNTFF